MAVEWYRKAAEQGDADAEYAMGLCYEEGTGVEQDFAQAAMWYEKAAQQGHADAQYETPSPGRRSMTGPPKSLESGTRRGLLYHSTKQHSGMKRLTNRKTGKSRQLWVQCFFRE